VRKSYYAIIAPLCLSLFIYLFYRTEKTVVNEIAIFLISFDNYAALKKAVTGFLPLNNIIIYSLPEGLWVFCITLTSKPYYIQVNDQRMNCVVIPLIFCVGLEILQLLHFTQGRFDITDILISVLFWVFGNYFFIETSNRQNILTSFNGRRMVCLATYGIVYLSHVVAK
jgi:hypothetical protein